MRKANTVYTQQYLTRKVMTCVCETQAHATREGKMFIKSLYDQVQREFKNTEFQFDEVDKRAHELLPTIYSLEDDSGREIKVIDKQTGETKNVMDCSLILKGIIEKIYICRIYVAGSRTGEIKRWISEKNAEYTKIGV
ncbi:MAG: hypothetical protein LBQ98_05005 [Nitrososphaerota archaeon]|nr:hypothetical protein [Nitrososphaerota archaeon]